MAETKRNSNAGKVATPKAGAQPMQETLDSLSRAIGARVKITTTSAAQNVLEGTLFTACPILNVLAVNTTPAPPSPSTTLANQPGDYHIIPISKIQNFQIISLAESADGFTSAAPSISRVDNKKLRERERARVRKLQDEERKRNKEAGPEAQSIYNALDRMLPTRWHGTDIIVNDAVIISAPYTAQSCKAPKEKQQALSQIKKVVEGERRKLAERARTTTPVPPRKGG